MDAVRIRTHWENPWSPNAVPIPVEALADLMAGERMLIWADAFEDRKIIVTDRAWWIAHWSQGGAQLDAYLLYDRKNRIAGGVRFGAEGHQYYSPYIRLDRQKAARLLWESFGGKP